MSQLQINQNHKIYTTDCRSDLTSLYAAVTPIQWQKHYQRHQRSADCQENISKRKRYQDTRRKFGVTILRLVYWTLGFWGKIM